MLQWCSQSPHPSFHWYFIIDLFFFSLFNIRWEHFCFAQSRLFFPASCPFLHRALFAIVFSLVFFLFHSCPRWWGSCRTGQGAEGEHIWGRNGGWREGPDGTSRWAPGDAQTCCGYPLAPHTSSCWLLKPLGEELEGKITFLFKLLVYQFPLGLCLSVVLSVNV